jgi:hypothetical protein
MVYLGVRCGLWVSGHSHFNFARLPRTNLGDDFNYFGLLPVTGYPDNFCEQEDQTLGKKPYF